MPGKVVDYLRTAELGPVERAVLDQGMAVRRGQGYTLRIKAEPAIHHQLLDLCRALDGTAAPRPSARPVTSTRSGSNCMPPLRNSEVSHAPLHDR